MILGDGFGVRYQRGIPDEDIRGIQSRLLCPFETRIAVFVLGRVTKQIGKGLQSTVSVHARRLTQKSCRIRCREFHAAASRSIMPRSLNTALVKSDGKLVLLR